MRMWSICDGLRYGERHFEGRASEPGGKHGTHPERGVKNAELCILPEAGHFSNEEVPALVTKIVLGFLRRQMKRVACKEIHDEGPTVRP